MGLKKLQVIQTYLHFMNILSAGEKVLVHQNGEGKDGPSSW